MNLKVIELNDSAIKVGDEQGIIVQSPGFALADGEILLLGDAAEQQARLKPTNSYNKYWHELSLEPISVSNKIRHYADIAYAHLLHLAEIGDIDSEVIFAVPGNFNRQQLSILLGLAQHSPITPVGVVDSAVAAAIQAASTSTVIYADLQLHQAILTRLQVVDGQLKSETVVQVPGVGSQNLINSMMQLATGLFIQQCRFNPQHNAESEQQLYNALPLWLQQGEQDEGNLHLELNAASTVHRAKMPRESLISHLSGHYQKIQQQITALATEQDIQLLLGPKLGALPGFTNNLQQFSQLLVVENHTVNSACLEYRDFIIGQETSGIHRVSALPVAQRAESASVVVAADEEIPTHALYASRAYPANKLDIRNEPGVNGHARPAAAIVLSDAQLPLQLGRIVRAADGVYFEHGEDSPQQVLINNKQISGRQKLQLGDRLGFGGNSEDICLIRVSDV